MAEESGLELVNADDDEPTVDVVPESIEQPFAENGDRKACLVFLTGPIMGHTVLLTEKPKDVGRAEDVDIVINDEGVSRRHARFYLSDDGVYVEDLESSNGVYVNGKRIERLHTLSQGDKITLGTITILKFTYHDQIDENFQQRLLESAINDPLTGLHNRAFFDQKLDGEFDYAARHRDKLGLILFDLDHFKLVNDTYGHLAGDAVLEQFGRLVREAVREEDFIARYGGEEFAMIGRGLSSTHAYQAAERLRKLVAEAEFEYDGTHIPVTISAGVVSFPEVDASSAAALIDAADQALYRSKDKGRNRTTRAVADAS